MRGIVTDGRNSLIQSTNPAQTGEGVAIWRTGLGVAAAMLHRLDSIPPYQLDRGDRVRMVVLLPGHTTPGRAGPGELLRSEWLGSRLAMRGW